MHRIARSVIATLFVAATAGVPALAQMALAPNEPAPQLEGFAYPRYDPEVVDWSEAELNLVYFWAEWCAPCEELTPKVQGLHAAHAGDGLRVIGVYDYAHTKEVVKRYRVKHDASFPMLRLSRRVGRYWGVGVLPTTYLIGKDGRVIRRYAGGQKETMHALVEDTNRVLDGRPLETLRDPGMESDADTDPVEGEAAGSGAQAGSI